MQLDALKVDRWSTWVSRLSNSLHYLSFCFIITSLVLDLVFLSRLIWMFVRAQSFMCLCGGALAGWYISVWRLWGLNSSPLASSISVMCSFPLNSQSLQCPNDHFVMCFSLSPLCCVWEDASSNSHDSYSLCINAFMVLRIRCCRSHCCHIFWRSNHYSITCAIKIPPQRWLGPWRRKYKERYKENVVLVFLKK